MTDLSCNFSWSHFKTHVDNEYHFKFWNIFFVEIVTIRFGVVVRIFYRINFTVVAVNFSTTGLLTKLFFFFFQIFFVFMTIMVVMMVGLLNSSLLLEHLLVVMLLH